MTPVIPYLKPQLILCYHLSMQIQTESALASEVNRVADQFPGNNNDASRLPDSNEQLKSIRELLEPTKSKADVEALRDGLLHFIGQASPISGNGSGELVAKLESFLRQVVSPLANFQIGKLFKAYLPESSRTPDSHSSVVTNVDEAFTTMQGLLGEDMEALTNRYQTKYADIVSRLNTIRTIDDSQAKNSEGSDDYYKWLDFDYLKSINSDFNKPTAAKMKSQGLNSALVCGMGGSSMYPKLIETSFPTDFKVQVQDNLDPGSLIRRLGALGDGIEKTNFVMISKSGSTNEVLQNLQIILDKLSQFYSGDKLRALKTFAKNTVFITEDNDKDLREIKAEIEAKTDIEISNIDHPAFVGGRYSMMSPVGMYIAELKGLDSDAFIAGAEECWDRLSKTPRLADSEIGKYALLDMKLAESGKFAARYVMPYSDRLELLPAASAQLTGEGTNKYGMNTLPQMHNRGTTGEHSDIEALCKTDKQRLLLEQILLANDTDHIHGDTGLNSLRKFAGKSANADRLQTHALPLNKYLRENKQSPVITTIIDKVDERNMGYIMTQRMLIAAVEAGLHDECFSYDNLQKAVHQSEVETFKKAKGSELAIAV